MPTVVLSTFLQRDATANERAAESALRCVAASAERLPESAKPERRVECRGLLRAHVRGNALEALIALQRLAVRRGGVTWAGPRWFAKVGICSVRHARRIFSGLVRDGWLISTDFHGRRAFRVLTHGEWSIVTGRCDAAKDILSARGGHFVPVTGTSSQHNPLKRKNFADPRSESEDQEVQDQSITSYCSSRPSEVLKKNITAKIEATNSTWASYLAEESEKSRSELRTKFAWVCRFLEFTIAENDTSLDWEFPFTLIEVYAENRKELNNETLTRGRFACKVIDRCKRDGILWPPAFTAMRDRWRQIELLSEANSTVEAA